MIDWRRLLFDPRKNSILVYVPMSANTGQRVVGTFVGWSIQLAQAEIEGSQ